MPKGKPSQAQVDLMLRLYEMRRETKLRAARDWFVNYFQPHSLEDIQRLAPQGSDQNAYMRMVLSYWEMVCAFYSHGLLHEDLFFETTGEQYLVWFRFEPIMGALREQFGYPKMCQHLERAARRYEKWMERRAPGYVKRVRPMMAAPQAAVQHAQ